MVDNHSEQEQLDELKRWWRENSSHVLAGLVLGVALVGGWRFWQAWETRQSEEASALHAEVVAAGAVGDIEKLDALFARLQADYARTPYGVQSALVTAQAAVTAGDLGKARAALEWASEHGRDPGLGQLVALRLARVLLAQGEAEAALGALARVDSAEFAVLSGELKGDALLALGRRTEAREAWSAALAARSGEPPAFDPLRIKLDELGAVAGATP